MHFVNRHNHTRLPTLCLHINVKNHPISWSEVINGTATPPVKLVSILETTEEYFMNGGKTHATGDGHGRGWVELWTLRDQEMVHVCYYRFFDIVLIRSSVRYLSACR